jgi:WD40 repeat protein
VYALSGHSSRVNAVAISADGKLALSGSADRTLKLWELDTGREVYALSGHSSRVNAVAISADGKLALSGSVDNTLKLWELDTGRVLATFTGESPFICCAFAPDGVTVVAGDTSGRVHFLRLEGIG